MTSRRELSFEDFESVLVDVQQLHEDGYDCVGAWDLAQICKHLAATLNGSVNGLPFKAPWYVRLTVGRLAKRQVLRSGRMPEGVKIPVQFAPKPGGDPDRAVRQLQKAVGRFTEYDGAYADHPFFGKLTPDQWRRLHLVHCAHHLSFLIPRVPT